MTKRLISPQQLLIMVACLVTLSLASWYIQKRIEQQVKQDVGMFLKAVTNTSVQGILSWERILRHDVQTWANQPQTVTLARQLREMTVQDNPPALQQLRRQLAQLLAPLLENRGYASYFIIGPDSRYLANSTQEGLGHHHRLGERNNYFSNLWHGQEGLSFPNHKDLLWQSRQGAHPLEQNMILSGAPIASSDGDIIGLLILATDPAQDFYPLLQQSRFSHSGETYAVDEQGWMLSHSRFKDNPINAEKIGRLLQGEDLTTQSPRETGMRVATFSADNALDWQEYPDYRGIQVLGYWQWISHLGIAVVSEIDSSDALQTTGYINTIIKSFTLLMLLLLFGTILFFSKAEKRFIISRTRLMQLNEELEKRVSQRTKDARAAAVAKGNFLANMSHEIRTPMNGILGTIEALSFTRLTREQSQFLKTLSNSSQHLMGLLNDILDFSKLDAGKLRLEKLPVNIVELLHQVKANFLHQASAKQINLELYYDKTLDSHYLTDPLRLAQILNNLVSNAIKFTQKGQVTIAVRRLIRNESPVVSGDPIHHLQLSVKDNGIGISEEQQRHLFDAFQQADNTITRRYGGTGLGLSICRELVTLMCGAINVESQPDIGTTFFVTLPLPTSPSHTGEVPLPAPAIASPPPFDASIEADEYDSAPAQPKKLEQCLSLLIAEDHPVNQLLLKGQLNQLGMKVDIADNGEQALKLYQENHYDAILSDCHMPVMDGYELASRIVALSPDDRPRLIAVTADVMDGALQKCLNAGFDDYLPKPCSLKELAGKLAGVKAREPAPET